jgi:hypothetical protein
LRPSRYGRVLEQLEQRGKRTGIEDVRLIQPPASRLIDADRKIVKIARAFGEHIGDFRVWRRGLPLRVARHQPGRGHR